MFIGIGLGLVAQAIYGGVGDNALNDYGTPFFLADFIESEYQNNGPLTSSFTALSGLTFTRASTGYAQTAAGVLVPFASGAPRITDKGLLIEGARTNLCLQSQTFDNASWTKANFTVTADAIAAPDGTLTADLMTVTSTAATNINQSVGAIAGTNCCASIYVQNLNRSDTATSFILYDVTGAANRVSVSINWAAMTVSGTGASIERLGSTNWYRIIMVDTAWTSGNVARIYPGAAGGSLSGGLAWYQWGAQIEAAAFPSSYIPTTTTSATRAADVCSIAVSGLAYPLTMFAEFEPNVISGAEQGILCADKSGGATDVAYMYKATSGAGTGFIYASGATQMTAAGAAFSAGSSYKLAMRVAANDGRYCQGGTLATLDSTVTLPNAPDRIILGQRYNLGGFQAFGYIRRAAIWPTAFSDANLQSVTN